MFHFTSRGIWIDAGGVELILICSVVVKYNSFCFQNRFSLKLGYVDFHYRIDFHTQIHTLTHVYTNLFKYKLLLVRITFNQYQFPLSHNQTYTKELKIKHFNQLLKGLYLLPLELVGFNVILYYLLYFFFSKLPITQPKKFRVK